MNEQSLSKRLWSLAETVREQAPLIHNMTSLVMQNDTADVIAAVGGTQITLHNLEEVDEIARLCAGFAVNLGTLDANFLACARQAVALAKERQRPWMLDPVAAGLTRYRTKAALDFLDSQPTLIKGNASEILVLAGQAEGGHGADSIHQVDDAAAAARQLARQFGSIVVVTGAEDLITDGESTATIANGQPLMGRMIGSGCMLTSVIACFLAVTDTPFEAAVAAVAAFNVAGELACESAGGPGTLKPLLIDALDGLTQTSLESRLRMTLR